jgi:hypothetical protein
MRFLAILFISVFLPNIGQTQMWNPILQDTLYGNEWINFNHADRYFKVNIAEDGMYRIPKNAIPSSANDVPADNFRIFHMGEEVTFYASTSGVLGNSDYLQFYGEKNRTALDEYLMLPGESMLNPEYSLFTDTAAYYLTWTESPTDNIYTSIDNDLTNLPNPESYFNHQEIIINTEDHNKRKFKTGSVSLEKSFFDEGEGFGKRIDNNNPFTHTFALTGINDLGNAPELTIRYAGSNNVNHLQTFSFNGEIIHTENFDNYEFRITSLELPNAAPNSEFILNGLPSESASNILTVGTAAVSYSRNFDFGGETLFQLEIPASSGKKYLEIENFNVTSDVFLYDLTNKLRIPVSINGSLGRVALPASPTFRQLVLVAESEAINIISNLNQTTFVDYSDSAAEFVIVSNPLVYFDQNGNNRVQEYADYRNNDFVTEIVDINELYDQFGYGVKRSPISIRNFAHFLQKNTSTVKYFFFIGDAREYHEVRTSEQLTDSGFFLPTYGKPGSDNLLLSKVDVAAPIYPLGRLTARNGDMIRDYLDKVIATEDNYDNPQTLEDRRWMKNILHLGGGGDDSEQAIIRNSLEAMSSILENSMYGATPHAFYKTSTDVIDESPRTAIERIVNDGLSILNFFGHSGPTGFDFPVQDPSEYNNQDRYFLMISNGCFSGRCHGSIDGIGEKFIFEPNKGAVAYFASNGYGYISSLNSFTRNYYDKLGNSMYGEGIGKAFQLQVLETSSATNYYSGTNLLSQQNTFQGDPALRLYPHLGPDLIPDAASVEVNPDLINTQIPSFEFKVDVVNVGKYLADSVNVELTMIYPNGEEAYTNKKRISVPSSSKTVVFDIPIDAEDTNIVGLNTIYIKVDSDEEYEEMPNGAEMNNVLLRESGQEGIEVLIVSNDVLPIFPKKYGITNQIDLELVASTVDVFAAQQNFVMQIDTTANFNSPLFRENIVNQSGGLLKWKPEINFEDDVVYYWRTSPEPENDNYRWNNSSFLYLEEANDGWNQSHYFQFEEDEYSYMELNENRNFKYVEDFKEIFIQNGVTYVGDGFIRPCLRINNVDQHCGAAHFNLNNGVRVFVLDSITLNPKLNVNDNNRKFFKFQTNNFAGRESLINFLQDSIEIGHYVAFVTIQKFEGQDYKPEDWAADSDILGINIFDILEAQGATIVRDLETLGARPYSFFFKKGYPDEIGGEAMTQPIGGEEGTIQSIYSASALYDEGSVISLPIGPAADWNRFEWNTKEVPEEFERTSVNIYGLKNDGTRDTLFAEVTLPEMDLSSVEANIYPKLQLEWFSRDSVQRSSPQLDNWRILYRGLPEAALNPQVAFEISQDTVQQGQTFNFRIGVENIGLYDMDSLLVNFQARDRSNSIQDYFPRYSPLAAGDTLTASVSVNTKELNQLSSLLIDMNPNEDQPEETHINNTGLLNFYVQSDRENPLLDVTFDGVHILNGDLVSPTPQIVASFTDENRFLAMEDTSQFQMKVVFPDRSEKRIYFSSPEVLFIPADETNLDNENKATIEYSPTFEEDGIYTLRVEGQDVTGNQSGELEYSIEFEIITKSMISNVLNYPNPFSTATRFVYTLTGNEQPASFKIQIMSVSGRIVREITQSELGEMKIGTHQTDFVWDGTDEFGDKLANGVYLYRVVAKNAAGEDIEQYDTGADKFFNQGFGKMVIVR